MQFIDEIPDEIGNKPTISTIANPLKIRLLSDGSNESDYCLNPMDIIIANIHNFGEFVTFEPVDNLCKKGYAYHSSTTNKRIATRGKPKVEFGSNEYNILINCNGLIESIDFDSLSHKDSIAILILVGTTHFECYCRTTGSLNLLHLYVLVYNRNDLDSEVECNKFNEAIETSLVYSFSIKDDRIMSVKWVKTHNSSDIVGVYLLFVMLTRTGNIKLCVIEKSKLNDRIESSHKNVDFNDSFENLCEVWEYDSSLNSSFGRIVCFDLAYSSDGNIAFTLAAGTTHGFLLVWRFSAAMLNKIHSLGVELLHIDKGFVMPKIRIIPVIPGINNTQLWRLILDVKFLPVLDSQIVAIGTFSKSIILWNIAQSHLEGEIKSMPNITKPVNAVGWTMDHKHLLGCGSTGYYIDWQHSNSIVSVTGDKFIRDKQEQLFDNACWSVDSTTDDVCFAFDDGMIIILPVCNLKKRNIDDCFTIYKWTADLDDDGYNLSLGSKEDPIHEKVQKLMFDRFVSNLSHVQNTGVIIMKLTNKESKYKGESLKQMRSKVLSHHVVRSDCVFVSGNKLKLLAYGGNLGLLHLVLKAYY